jgi:hypothetical protein
MEGKKSKMFFEKQDVRCMNWLRIVLFAGFDISDQPSGSATR